MAGRPALLAVQGVPGLDPDRVVAVQVTTAYGGGHGPQESGQREQSADDDDCCHARILTDAPVPRWVGEGLPVRR
jgi:hypothetical protein